MFKTSQNTFHLNCSLILKVEAVSTVGAGDSFSASFLARYLKSDNIASALDIATKISGYVVSCTEAIPDYDMNDFD